jgi:hypothetical protein
MMAKDDLGGRKLLVGVGVVAEVDVESGKSERKG